VFANVQHWLHLPQAGQFDGKGGELEAGLFIFLL
jgi:hypothetical protein